jgi:hypothetical protein
MFDPGEDSSARARSSDSPYSCQLRRPGARSSLAEVLTCRVSPAIVST